MDLEEKLQSKDTLMAALDITFEQLTADKVVCKMPVGPKTKQPMGLLHGGASVALAETAASIAAMLNIDLNTHAAVGIEINANHVRGKKDGVVTAVATPLHRGQRTMVWDVKIHDEEDRLISVSRCTVAIIENK